MHFKKEDHCHVIQESFTEVYLCKLDSRFSLLIFVFSLNDRSASSIAPITATSFAVDYELRRFFRAYSNVDEVKDSQKIAIAAFSGFASAFIATPTDLIIIQQQKMKTSLSKATNAVLQKYGFRGLYKGLFGCSMRESLFACGLLGVSPVLKRTFVEKFETSTYVSGMLAAVTAGVISAVLSHPFDTVKTCQQADLGFEGAAVRFDTFANTARTIYKENGENLSVFFRGITPRTLRIIGAVFIISECRSILHPFFIKD
jgi:solute carrier family 25 2-oxodicarboxylate transporter 21